MKKIIYSCSFLLAFGYLNAQTQVGSTLNGDFSMDQFGVRVAISQDGSVIAAGAHTNMDKGAFCGQVKVFKNVSGTWTQIGDNLYGNVEDLFGRALDLSDDGNILAVGAPYNDTNGITDSGQVKIFKQRFGAWEQIGAPIYGQAISDSAGYSVALSGDGNFVAVGSFYSSAYKTQSGQVRIFQNIEGTWKQVGEEINGEGAYDASGYSVAISDDGTKVAIGAPKNNGNGTESGQTRIYQYSNGAWIKMGQDIDGKAANDNLGTSVSLSSDGYTVAMGAPKNASGYTRVYHYDGTNWIKVGSDINGTSGLSGQCVSISSNGSVLAIGAPSESSGKVKIFENVNGTWTQKGTDINGSGYFGYGVSLSSDGQKVVGGAMLANNRTGQVSVYDLSTVLDSNQFVYEQSSLYPNPTKNFFRIDLNQNLNFESINIYSLLGQMVMADIKTQTVDVSSLAKGIYLVQVKTDKGSAVKKLTIE